MMIKNQTNNWGIIYIDYFEIKIKIMQTIIINFEK